MVAQKKEKRNMVAHLLAKWSLNSGGVNFSDVTSAAHVLLMFFFFFFWLNVLLMLFMGTTLC